jgi:uncharacterized protein (TIRG00374 family)
MLFGSGNWTRGRASRWLAPLLGYAIALACLIWVYHGFDWKRELPRLAATDWRWVTLAVVADIAVYALQGWRWNLLLNPLKKVPLLRSIQAIYIGLFANEVLPLRSGEVIRCYLQGRWNHLPFSVVLSSAIVERLFDGIWLVLGFYVATYFVTVPRLLVEASKFLVLVLAVVTFLLAVVIFYKGHAHEAVSRSRWAKVLWHVVEGVHIMGNSRSFYVSAAVSFFYLALQIVPVYTLMLGYGLDLSFGAATVVLVILRVGSIPPQAPGNVGAFQFFTIMGLRILGVDRPHATGFATLLFVVVTVPLWVVGFIALIGTRMRLEEIHRDAQNHFSPAEATASPAPGTTQPQSNVN